MPPAASPLRVKSMHLQSRTTYTVICVYCGATDSLESPVVRSKEDAAGSFSDQGWRVVRDDLYCPLCVREGHAL